MAKTNTAKEAEIENTEAQVGTQEETKTNTAKEAGKVYKFTSENKYLTVTAVKVQFIAGKAETTDLNTAKYLATLDGVSLVED